jgi:hypothetical protein
MIIFKNLIISILDIKNISKNNIYFEKSFFEFINNENNDYLKIFNFDNNDNSFFENNNLLFNNIINNDNNEINLFFKNNYDNDKIIIDENDKNIENNKNNEIKNDENIENNKIKNDENNDKLFKINPLIIFKYYIYTLLKLNEYEKALNLSNFLINNFDKNDIDLLFFKIDSLFSLGFISKN